LIFVSDFVLVLVLVIVIGLWSMEERID